MGPLLCKISSASHLTAGPDLVVSEKSGLYIMGKGRSHTKDSCVADEVVSCETTMVLSEEELRRRMLSNVDTRRRLGLIDWRSVMSLILNLLISLVLFMSVLALTWSRGLVRRMWLAITLALARTR